QIRTVANHPHPRPPPSRGREKAARGGNPRVVWFLFPGRCLASPWADFLRPCRGLRHTAVSATDVSRIGPGVSAAGVAKYLTKTLTSLPAENSNLTGWKPAPTPT